MCSSYQQLIGCILNILCSSVNETALNFAAEMTVPFFALKSGVINFNIVFNRLISLNLKEGSGIS
jgi:hypothetical protein